MPEKHLQKNDIEENDPFDIQNRMIYLRKNEIDKRNHSEKVKDKVIEAGNDTRNANQFVKLVNAHIQEKVSHLEKVKAEQNRFWEEMDMFKSDPKPEQSIQKNQSQNVEEALIMRELTAMMNRYGIEKIIQALDKISKQ